MPNIYALIKIHLKYIRSGKHYVNRPRFPSFAPAAMQFMALASSFCPIIVGLIPRHSLLSLPRSLARRRHRFLDDQIRRAIKRRRRRLRQPDSILSSGPTHARMSLAAHAAVRV